MGPRKIFHLTILGILLFIAGIAGTLYLISLDDGLVPILMYHSVEECDNPKTPTVSPDVFKRQMFFLKSNEFSVLSLEDYVSALKNRKRLPYYSVVITFDDGYENNYTQAYPALKQAEFPATIFVSSHFVSKPGYLDANQLNEMADNRISIGAHTQGHVYLPSLPDSRKVSEIQGAKSDLEYRLKVPVKFFCYPMGGYDSSVEKIVKDAGYLAACTTNRSRSVFNTDIYALNRIKMTDGDRNEFTIWVKTSRIYNFLKGLRRKTR